MPAEHMTFDRDTQEWQMRYDPYQCGQRRCGGMCPILGHELNKKKGNVFYDFGEAEKGSLCLIPD